MKTWTKAHGIKILYLERGKRRRYHPDILVEYEDGRIFLEEVKGRIFDKINFAGKNLAAFLWCQSRGIIFRMVFKDDLETVL